MLLVALALACVLPAATAGAQAREPVSAAALYGGVGSWLDIFAGAPWSHPRAVVAALKARGVRTLYLETSNYSHPAAIVYPAATGRFLDAAHAAGIGVVAWYLPSFAHPSADLRHALAAIRFRSAGGERFDSFALDIEASVVRNVKLRSRRLLALSSSIRQAAPAGYPLGAIVPSPVGMTRHPDYWPGFPWARLARAYDAFLPMAYFTNYVHTPTAAYGYARDVVVAIRRGTDRPDLPIHLIGGLANRASAAEIGGFARAASDCGVDGISLYAYLQTSAAQWARLGRTELGSDPAPACSG